MKRKMMCIHCSVEFSKRNEDGKLDGMPDFFYAQIEDEGAYNIDCPNGHKIIILLGTYYNKMR